jgi:UDP-N-acetylglucosamine--N-acetylmuramyl-(pentapeptide) pyrophosphoryl-undecaprenol N-acetylglucosamine transferase
MPNYRFMLSGGGTGGHIFPALAIADELKLRYPNAEFLFVGAKDRMEMEKIPAAGYSIKGLWISGIQRSLSLKNFVFPFKLISSLLRSGKLIKQFKPHLVVGTGGFASGPLLHVASNKGVPCLIQEQNSYPGITNKILANKALKICVAYPKMERFFPAEKIVLTGNPLRKNLQGVLPVAKEAKAHFGFSADAPVLLILGGSLGARRINELVSESLTALQAENIGLLWQCGKLYYSALAERHPEKENSLKLQAFLNDMPSAFAAADLVVSRAGASTLSELAVVGKPAILVPSPNVAEDHQTKNALALVEAQAAVLFKENGSAEAFASEIIGLLKNKDQLQNLSKNIKKLALPNAAATIVDEIEKLLPHA